MNLVAGLESFLYVISSLLLVPVVTGLVLLTCWVVIFFGWFLREALDRRRGHCRALAVYQRLLDQELAAQTDRSHLDLVLERLLQTHELLLVRGLDAIRFVIRVGPALGLMGTLIPMGIALSAMAQGDMPKMAGSMVTAFTTVIVGLACSVVAYLLSLIKEKWVRADMREMEFLTEQTLREHGCRREPVREEEADELAAA